MKMTIMITRFCRSRSVRTIHTPQTEDRRLRQAKRLCPAISPARSVPVGGTLTGSGGLPVPSSGGIMAVIFLVVFLGSFASQAAEKDKTKEKPRHERGWIGGEYRVATARTFPHKWFPNNEIFYDKDFPTSVSQTQKTGIFIKHLGTNTPARLAGLQKDDLIVALNGQPVTSLQKFRRIIDHSKPGELLRVTAYRHGEAIECVVPVGRETFEHRGMLSVTLPSVVHGWDLWPNPDLSFVFVGWDLNRGLRKDIKEKKEGVDDNEWGAWAGIFEVRYDRHILSQENAAAAATEPAK